MFMIVLSACGAQNATPAKDSQANVFQGIATADASSMISQNKDMVILDVRTPEEYAQGHLENAVNVDFRGSDGVPFRDRLQKLDPAKTYLVYCRTGQRSKSATQLMLNSGFTQVYNLEGGITKWQTDRGAVVK